MKVLIIRNAFEHDFGGAEKLSVQVAEEISNLGYESIVISRHKQLLSFAKSRGVKNIRGWWWSKQNWSGISCLLLPIYMAWLLALIFYYIFIFLKYSPDVIQIFSKDDFISGTIAGKILGKQIIWTDCADLKHILKLKNAWYKNLVGRVIFWASLKANWVCSVSYSEKKLVEESLGRKVPNNYTVIRLGAKEQKPNKISRNDKDTNSVIFCTASRMVTDKGIAELIDAFLRLQEKDIESRLWLIGDGKEKNLFEKRAVQNKNIVFFGHINNPLDYVNISDVFVLATYHEGFSLSLTEACMLGKPMIATNVGGNPEIVDDTNGILVKPKDPKELFEAMFRLAKDRPARLNLGEKAKKDYLTKLSFSLTVKNELVPLYER